MNKRFITIGFIIALIGVCLFMMGYSELPPLEPNKIYWPEETPAVEKLNFGITFNMIGLFLFIYGFVIPFRVNFPYTSKKGLGDPKIKKHDARKDQTR
jgi:uncharacterized membrane protein